MQAVKKRRRGRLFETIRDTPKRVREKFKYLDLVLLLLIIGVLVFGVTMVYSASSNMNSGSSTSFLFKQAFFSVISVSTMLLIFSVDINWSSTKIDYLISVFLAVTDIGLLIALVAGPVTSGAKGWIYIGTFGIQPVEYFKVAMILWFAKRFARNVVNPYKVVKGIKERVHYYKDFIAPGIGILLTALMPDLGGALILFALVAIIFLTSGIRPTGLITMVGIVIGVLIMVPVLLPVLEKLPLMHYQLLRFESYIDPWKTEDAGHQLINSYYAISNGGFWGRGLGNSIQKAGYLPEPNTDFIMAIVGEELGAAWILIILDVFGFIIWRLVIYAVKTRNMQIRLTLYGIAAYIGIQILVNLGGVVGVVPITGVTFPLISYGGSSLMSWGITFGIAFNMIGVLKKNESLRERE